MPPTRLRLGHVDQWSNVKNLHHPILKTIEHELEVNLDLVSLVNRNLADVEMLGLLAKEGWQRSI